MKIVHVNNWDTGGAANAAKRLFRAQKENGMDVAFLSLKCQTKEENDLNSYERFMQKKYGVLLTKIIIIANRIYNLIPTKFNYKVFFNRPESLYRVDNHPLIKDADIVHLHSIVKFIDIPTFFKNVDKPIIWTLHDMNPFSGGMHYESMMKGSLSGLEKKFIQIKRKSFQKKNIYIVAPSLWLKELSEKSEVLSSFPHFCIPYCLNNTLFYKTHERNNLEKMKILFVAEDINDPRKGFKYLLEALNYLDKNIQINILGNVTNRDEFSNYKNLNFLGYIASPNELSKIYSDADVYVISSIEDNLPNTIIESHMCGTPVVGFKTTGVANMISDEVNGILVESVNGKALAEGIKKALKMVKDQKISSQEIIEISHEYYSEKKVVNEYNAVYAKALSNRNS